MTGSKAAERTPPGHLPFLDGWRGLAILLVLVGHCA
jgi:peptidoglycan/LPS O-acetylase OafA/YrhL